MKVDYYNEFDHATAEWLRQLIDMGEIPEGEVDERSITDVKPGDLKGFVQCHFFAGVAGWPEALRRAGVPADRHVWTGSCPCQDYSCAGKGKGMEGERDLWPHFFRLIRECRPERVFGEQVEDAIGHGWLDRLSADMEAEGYAVGSVVLGAHSAGADHIRQRLYWVADAEHSERRTKFEENAKPCRRDGFRRCSNIGRLEDASRFGRRGRSDGDTSGHGGTLQAAGSGGLGGMVDSFSERGRRRQPRIKDAGDVRQSGETGGFWSRAVAVPCRDNCFRRFEPGIFPLVAKLPRGVGYSGDPRLPEYADQTGEARVMRLKGYGNAICVETARIFIEACEDVIQSKQTIQPCGNRVQSAQEREQQADTYNLACGQADASAGRPDANLSMV